jgi:membrane protein
MDINKFVKKIDAVQQKRKGTAFIYAVIKKYGEDNGGYQAALLTYYGFLSLFPLLLVLVTVLQLWFKNDPQFQHEVSTSVGHFFPLLGSQLQENIHGMKRVGVGLVVGLLFTIYGARGAADAFRYTVDNMWQIPKNKRAGFPKNMLHSLAIMGAATAAFGATVAVSAFTADLGHIWWAKLLANISGVGILAIVIGYSFRIATAKRLRLRYMMLGAGIAAAILQLLLSFGGFLLARELHNFSAVYGTFAVVLGLLFWIYLMSQVLLLSAEIDTVRHFKLWPRSLSGKLKTDADELADNLFCQEDKYMPNETVKKLLKL